MMTKLNDLFGLFQKAGSKLFRANLPGYLQVGHRKVTTPTKPPQFLIYKSSEGEQYISSMYPLNDALDAYKIEYGGMLARLEYTTPDTVVISPWEKVCVNINYKP